MRATRVFLLLLCLSFFFTPFIPAPAKACGHDGFYVGAGYTQLFMYTPEHQLSLANAGRVWFSPGYGANAVFGYDFCGSRWGIQMPFEFTRQRLNHSEWVNQFVPSVEAVFHLAEWANGLDVHFVGGVGGAYISEGPVFNRSSAGGIVASLGPGLSWFFTRQENQSGALALEIPVRMIHYFGDHLTGSGTTILAIPIRLTVQLGF